MLGLTAKTPRESIAAQYDFLACSSRRNNDFARAFFRFAFMPLSYWLNSQLVQITTGYLPSSG
ncbi:Uncharacterised protein [Pseudomonas putida]|nr:Uncharacterised protein [Pseudomonas putida]